MVVTGMRVQPTRRTSGLVVGDIFRGGRFSWSDCEISIKVVSAFRKASKKSSMLAKGRTLAGVLCQWLCVALRSRSLACGAAKEEKILGVFVGGRFARWIPGRRRAARSALSHDYDGFLSAEGYVIR